MEGLLRAKGAFSCQPGASLQDSKSDSEQALKARFIAVNTTQVSLGNESSRARGASAWAVAPGLGTMPRLWRSTGTIPEGKNHDQEQEEDYRIRR
jgi:hypothetical protein